MKTHAIFVLFFFFLTTHLSSQTIEGKVLQEEEDRTISPVYNATIYWQGTSTSTQSDSLGFFQIQDLHLNSKLIISYTGFIADTLTLSANDSITVKLHSKTHLKTVEISVRQSSTYLSSLNPINTEILTTAELNKAACCNLSESFETNNSVDVSSTDAVTGTKKITMLGLSGIYTQITQENLPSLRGLLGSSGLQQLPGTWIESIQISKGVGSVANGFESITGQINIELKKPFDKETFMLNGYFNQMNRSELNLNKSIILNKKWATLLFVHGDYMKNPIDRNKDKFMDVPDGNQWNVLNRWMYRSGKNLSAQFGVQAVGDKRRSGTAHQGTAFDVVHDWRFNKEVYRIDAFGKLGYIFPQKPNTSIGFLGNTQVNRQRTVLGNRWYDADQQSAYGSIIFQSYFGNSNHKYRLGTNVQYDRMEEYFSGQPFLRKEFVAGAFFEYTLTAGKSVIVGGIRADHNSLFGSFITPRLHYKYQVSEKTTFRISGGRGQRTANIIEENLSYLVSSRLLILQQNQAALGKAYGFLPEIAWNSGIGMNTSFTIFGQEGSISADVFETWFQRQVVIDVDNSPHQLRIYNLDGKSQAISSQVDYNQAIGRRFDLRISYKYTYTQTQYLIGNRSRPFVSPHRAILNLAFHSRQDKWLIDFTANYISSKRLPSSASNPSAFQMPLNSPNYVLDNTQITRNIKRWSFYIGVENLLDVYQLQMIVSPDDPHSQYFDASYIWGPNFGRMIYTGFRFKIAS